jgi:hypothetical protein
LKKLSKHEGLANLIEFSKKTKLKRLQELIEFSKSMIFLAIYDPAVNLRGIGEIMF